MLNDRVSLQRLSGPPLQSNYAQFARGGLMQKPRSMTEVISRADAERCVVVCRVEGLDQKEGAVGEGAGRSGYDASSLSKQTQDVRVRPSRGVAHDEGGGRDLIGDRFVFRRKRQR